MPVSPWAEIRRLSEVEGLSRREIAKRLHCCQRTVKRALKMASSPGQASEPARALRPQVHEEPDPVMQMDWRICDLVHMGSTQRRVLVLVTIVGYSHKYYVEFHLSRKNAELDRALVVHALPFFAGSPRRIIFDNSRRRRSTDRIGRTCPHQFPDNSLDN